MATISISSQKSADPAPLVYTISLPDADLICLITAWGPVLYPGDANITGAEVFNRLAERVVDQIKTETETYLQQQAATAAAAKVTPLSVSAL